MELTRSIDKTTNKPRSNTSMMRVCSRPVVSAPHRPSGTILSSPKTASELVLRFLPLTRLRRSQMILLPLPGMLARLQQKPNQLGTCHVTKSQARAATIANLNPPKQPAVHLSSKGGRSVRASPTPIAGSTKKSPQINRPTRPATATGRLLPPPVLDLFRPHAYMHALPLPRLYDHRPR